MRWSTLWEKIGKLSMKQTRQHDVYAVLFDQKSHKYIRRYLMLKYDAHGNPYLVEDRECSEKHERKDQQKFWGKSDQTK